MRRWQSHDSLQHSRSACADLTCSAITICWNQLHHSLLLLLLLLLLLPLLPLLPLLLRWRWRERVLARRRAVERNGQQAHGRAAAFGRTADVDPPLWAAWRHVALPGDADSGA